MNIVNWYEMSCAKKTKSNITFPQSYKPMQFVKYTSYPFPQFQSAMCGYRQTTVSICYVWLQTNNSFKLLCVVTDKQQFQSAMYDYRQPTLLSQNPALGLTWYI